MSLEVFQVDMRVQALEVQVRRNLLLLQHVDTLQEASNAC